MSKTARRTPRAGARSDAPNTRNLLPAGLHVAPFLSPAGRLVVLAIGQGHYLQVAAEIQQMAGCRNANADNAFALTGQAGAFALAGQVTNPPASALSEWILEPQAAQGGYIPFLNPGNAGPGRRALARIQLAPGVHEAPWLASWSRWKGYRTIRPLLAIDADHHLVAEMNVLPEDVESARRDLAAFLAAPSDPDERDPSADARYVDPYDDGEPDDCCGEHWKR